ncbi:MAG: hypothetical protein J7K88_08660, partial [Candidatus Fermentibacteraceae bacterium]|nr:hypothetical protein [Candidatus Fermentibacteraceae bacterium]
MRTLLLKSPLQIRTDLAAVMKAALEDTFHAVTPKVEVVPSRNLSFGDLACSSAMPLAGKLK